MDYRVVAENAGGSIDAGTLPWHHGGIGTVLADDPMLNCRCGRRCIRSGSYATAVLGFDRIPDCKKTASDIDRPSVACYGCEKKIKGNEKSDLTIRKKIEKKPGCEDPYRKNQNRSRSERN